MSENDTTQQVPQDKDTTQSVAADAATESAADGGGIGPAGGALGTATISAGAAASRATDSDAKPQVSYIWGDAARKNGWWWGTGRRKTAVARVRIRPGNGELKINKRDLEVYFTEDRDRSDVLAPLRATNTENRMDVHVNVHGGGFMGQAQAIRLGIARALKVYDCSLEQILRNNNFLTRDARAVERKKPGQSGARKRFQFSKR